MPTENQWLLWLVFSAVAAGVFLAVGAVAVRFRRQPIERLRLIQWTMLACLLAPLVNQLPGLPQWSFVWPTALPQPIEHAERVVASISNSQAVRRDEQVSAHSTPASIPVVERPIEQPIEVSPKRAASVDRSPADSTPLQIDVNPTSKPSTSNPIPAIPSTEPPQLPASSPSPSWTRFVLMAYAVGVAIMCGWYAIGYLALVWLNRTTRPVPDHVAELFRSAVADPAALKVRLGMHRRVELPLAFGLWRPTILLPEQMCLADALSPPPRAEEGRVSAGDSPGRGEGAAFLPRPLGEGRGEAVDAALRYSLIHEWSHLARGDVWRWRLSTIVGIVFFYQPLFWWLRRQLRLCQDYLADSHAALSPSPSTGEGWGEGAASTAREDYAQFLVSLAHRRLGLPGTLALSVGDGRSNLYRRVQMLLENRQPLVQHLRWPRRLAIAATAIALIALASTIRLTSADAQSSAKPAAQTAESAKSPDAQSSPKSTPAGDTNAETLTCIGFVQDSFIGKPIEGAKITIWKMRRADPTAEAKVEQRFETTTDADGKYTFVLPTTHPWARGMGLSDGPVNLLELNVDVKHSNYAPRREWILVPLTKNDERRKQLASRANTVKNAEGFGNAGDDPSLRRLEIIELPTSAEATGLLQSPDGRPIAGVQVLAYSRVPKKERGTEGLGGMRSKDETRSDANGRFRVQLITPGEAMLGIYPDKDFAPAIQMLYDNRGDLGVIKLEPGPQISGQVLDLQGKPLPGVYVSIEPWTPSDPKYSDTSVNQQPKRVAQTDSEGKFSVAPLAPGEYRIEPREELNDSTIDRLLLPEKHPLPAMFAPQKLTITDGQQSAKVELRAIPTVAVEGQIYSVNLSNLIDGMKSQYPSNIDTPAPAIEGKIDRLPYRTTPQFEKDGKFKFVVPKGLSEPIMRIDTQQNVGTAWQPRWRLGADQPIHSDPTIELGTLDSDVHGIEIDYNSTRSGQGFGADANTGGAGQGPGQGRRGVRGRGAPELRPGAINSLPNPQQESSSASPANPPSGNPAAAPAGSVPAELNVTGKVQDAESHQPIEGAEVTVWVADGLGSSNFKRLLAVKSDATGQFTFPVSTSLAKQMHFAPGEGGSAIYLDFQVKHPNYATRRQNSSIVVAVDLGGRPMIRRIEGNAREVRMPIEMQRGEVVTAVLKGPEGKPAAGVKIVPKDAPEDALTDADGRFQMNFPATGDASFWIYPRSDGVPVKYELHEKRGDLGIIKLQPGQTISGRVLDANGQPLAGIYLRAYAMSVDSNGRFPKDFIWRAAITDKQGQFTFAPLPPGDYRVEPQNAASDLSTERLYDSPVEPHPLPAFFTPQKVTLLAGQEPQPIEFRPPETVVITGKVSAPTPDRPARSANQNPFEQYKPGITGLINGFKFSPEVTIDADGKFLATVPRGLQEVIVKPAGSQVRGPQWRTAKDKPLVDPFSIPLGTVNEDVHDLEIVYP